MESKNTSNISVDIPNYSGPLEILLDLAKSQIKSEYGKYLLKLLKEN